MPVSINEKIFFFISKISLKVWGTTIIYAKREFVNTPCTGYMKLDISCATRYVFAHFVYFYIHVCKTVGLYERA